GYHEAQVKEGMHDHNNPSQDHNQHDDSDHSGHDHEHHHHGNFKEIFLKSLPLGIVILLWSPMMDVRLPFQFTFPCYVVAVAMLATILLIYRGKPFCQGAIAEFKEQAPGMLALISLGVSFS